MSTSAPAARETRRCGYLQDKAVQMFGAFKRLVVTSFTYTTENRLVIATKT